MGKDLAFEKNQELFFYREHRNLWKCVHSKGLAALFEHDTDYALLILRK